MGVLPADLWREPHHDGLGDDQPAADIEILRHLFLVDDQAREREFRLMQRACGQHEALRESHPFGVPRPRSEEHTSELQSQFHLVCRLLLEKKKTKSTATLTKTNKRRGKSPN